MHLRGKVILILAIVWALISIALLFDAKLTIEPNYLDLEKKNATEDLVRAKHALTDLTAPIEVLAHDWSNWDDVYQFVKDLNPQFIKTNLEFTTFSNAKINLILFFDEQEKLVYEKYFDLVKNEFEPLPTGLKNYFKSKNYFVHHLTTDSNKAGFLQTNEGIVVMVSLPILHSSGEGPIAGTIVMGYYLKQHQLDTLASTLDLKIKLIPIKTGLKNPELQQIYKTLLNDSNTYLAINGENFIHAYTIIYDIEGKPFAILQVTNPQNLYSEGIQTIKRYLFIIFIIGILMLFLTWYLLQLFVLNRIIKVSDQVIAIYSSSEFSQRINVSGKDEIGNMGKAINSLMEIIELTQEQLKYRILQRTEKLDRLLQLNKNLFSEINKQKITEKKLRDDEKDLRKMAYYDGLTGLPNRFFFNELLQNAILKASHKNASVVLMFLDADKFKSINDTYGHDIGDHFLQYVAHQLKSVLKDTDVVARVAGDEFIIYFTGVSNKNDINGISEKLLNAVSKPFVVNNHEIQCTFSIGISIFPKDGVTVEDLERHADLAMYYAKKQSGNMYCYYDAIAGKK